MSEPTSPRRFRAGIGRHGRILILMLVLCTSIISLGFLTWLAETGGISVDSQDRLLIVAFSLSVVLLGLLPLRQMLTWERSIGPYGAPLAFSYFLIQHFVFGFGGFLFVVSDQGYYYENLQGVFRWADGVVLLQLIHLVSLYVGLIGTWLVRRASTNGGKRLPVPAGYAKPISDRQSRLFQKLCYVSLFFHALGWVVLPLVNLPDSLKYLVDSILYTLNCAYFFWGFGWSRLGRGRWVFTLYATMYGALELTKGNRTFFLFPLALFFLGLFVSQSRWRVNSRQLVAVALLLALAGVLTVRSEDVRILYQRGWPSTFEEWGARLDGLLKGESVAANRVTDAKGQVMNPIFRLGSRIFELSALDVVARTPKDIAYWGWSGEDWGLLLTGWLPAYLFPDLPFFSSENAGVFYLRKYGWILDPLSGGSAQPATLLADSWRRFGWLGVIVFYLAWAVLLSWLTLLLTRRRFNLLWFVFSGGMLANLAFTYSLDINTVLTSLPRKTLMTLVFAVATSIIVRLWASLELAMSTRARWKSAETP